MILKEVLKNLKNVKIIGEENTVVRDVFSDSKQVTKDSLFISISKTKEEKYNEIKEAVNKGAVVIVIEDEELVAEIPKDIVKVLVSKTNIAKAAIACNFFDNPSTKMNVIGITGTKGKTITSMLLREVLVAAGKKVGLITNLYNAIENKIISKEKTFLDTIDLQRLLSEMHKEKIEYVILEVPEMSIKDNKILGCKFDNVIYTNLIKDYIVLEDKQTLEDYVENQLKIFKWSDLNIVNNDSFFSNEIIELSKKSVTYGLANRSDYTAIDINCRSTRIDYLVPMEGKVERVVVNIPGRYIVENSLSVVALAMHIGISARHVLKGLLNVKIPGVYEVVENKYEIPVIIDGAKTIKDIENILISLRPYSTGRLTTVIGLDDKEDSKTREFIGEILGKLSDNTIVTTYNPREKDPEKLGQILLSGIRKVNGKAIQINDRKEAIEFAISKAQRRDLVLLLGMGDERFLEIGNEHVVFDERKIVEEFFNKNKPGDYIPKDKIMDTKTLAEKIVDSEEPKKKKSNKVVKEVKKQDKKAEKKKTKKEEDKEVKKVKTKEEKKVKTETKKTKDKSEKKETKTSTKVKDNTKKKETKKN